MKSPKHEFERADRMATREELFQVLELLGGFEAEAARMGSARERLEGLGEDGTRFSGMAEDWTASEEELFNGIGAFGVSTPSKIERIN